MTCILAFLMGCERSPATASATPAPIFTAPTPSASPPTPQTWSASDRSVLLVSLDGYRWDYPERAQTPALDRLMAEGVRADALIPVFPSKTFPNHFSQVTGLYPAEHGIVGNSFYDQDLEASFDMSEIGSEWWGGEPIWITAAKQGRRTTTMFWPGSETPFDGVLPDVWVPFDDGVPNEVRVDQVLEWMAEPVPPHFATLYFSEVDTAGHAYGPDSAEVTAAIEQIDAALGRLIDGLEAQGRLDAVDILVVSDHGMAQQSRDRAIFLEDHLNPDDFWIAAWGPYVTLDPKNGDTTGVLEALAGLPHASCSDETTRPADLHFPSGPRIPPLLCIADLGWSITTRSWLDNHTSDLTGATHGYLPSEPEMQGLFVARGPHFQSGVTHPAFSSIHLYALMADLLEIDPAAQSGSLEATEMMRSPDAL